MTEHIENTDVIVEKPVELTAGEMLRNARTTGRRKREIPTIAKQLCIREEFLEALENGDYKVIPEQVYILGFTRNYAMELGLNPDEIVARVKKEMGIDADCVADDEDVTACAMPSIKEESWFKVTWVKIYQFIYQHWIWFVGAIAAIAVAVFAIVLLQPSAEEATVDTQEVVAVPANTVTEPEYKVPVRERFGTSNREKANVILQANAETGEAGTWVEVKGTRGRTALSRILLPGDVYYVPVGDKYKATFGNAGGIDIWVNGVLAPQVGQDHKRITGVELVPEKLLNASK